MSGPVEDAEKRARRHRGVAAAAVGGDEGPNAALVTIALGDDPLTQPRREGVHLEVGRGSFHLVEQAQHMRRRELSQAVGKRTAVRPTAFLCSGQRLEQAVQRPVLAEEEQFLFALEVVIQVPRREVGGDGDVAHAGVGEAARAKYVRGRPHDLDTPGIHAFRTTVRRVNHRSILSEPECKEIIWAGRSAAPWAQGL